MDNVQPPTSESLSHILYRFSLGISAITVAKTALGNERIDPAVIDQALTLAVDGMDDAYNQLDRAILSLYKPPMADVTPILRPRPSDCEKALSLMVEARRLLVALFDAGAIDEGSPPAETVCYLDQAIGMLKPEVAGG